MKLVNVNRPVYRVNPVDALLKDFFNANGVNDRYDKEELVNQPSTNLFETETSVVLELLIPGYSKEEIKLQVENNQLIVKSESLENESDKQKDAPEYKYSRVEFEKAKFEKRFRLSDKLNQEQIQAEVKNGILRITLAKKKEAIPVKREIEIG